MRQTPSRSVLKSWSVLASLVLLLLLPRATVHAAPTDIPSAASFYVPSLPDIHQNPDRPLTIFAGHLPADPHASQASSTEVVPHLFFVLVKNRRLADRPRIMFWFNGGPGCSSFDGLMMEIGPWRSDGNGGFNVVEGGWEEYTTIVYVDQPAGTGYSYTSTDKYVHTTQQATEQFIQFLRYFYAVFPEYEHVDTYLGGESFAGQYIPYFAQGILDSTLGIPLRGAAIGNGWIDARRQYPSYIDYAVKMGILEKNSDAWKEAKKKTDECVAALNEVQDREPVKVVKCESLLMDVMKVREREENGTRMCINIYDVRLDDTYPACGMNWPQPLANVTRYLGRQDVVRALHADSHPGNWIECRGQVHQQYHEDTIESSISVLPKVLVKIPVLIFAGDQDLICNYVGMEAMIQAMTWNGETGFGTVQTQTWTVDGSPAGTWVSSRNLTYTKIFNASHMAPYDVPHVTHDMILRFMGFNFSEVVEGSARIPSAIGADSKPIFIQEGDAVPTTTPVSGKTPEQDKAMWEAYYNAGSSALVLLLIFLGIGGYIWYRTRRKGLKLPLNDQSPADEVIPLNASIRNGGFDEHGNGHDNGGGDVYRRGSLKGKERARASDLELEQQQRGGGGGQAIFDVGDSDEDEVGENDGFMKGRR
ncbi:hypothetical protein AX16_007806 [Volvariella volvacea WC 439]|nr:hypothetical protein AX16_007806 [Volvariella volvacea WC 439]